MLEVLKMGQNNHLPLGKALEIPMGSGRWEGGYQ